MSDLNESLPIYVRIVEGVKDAILSGDLKEDEKILSTTYFSKTYNINIAMMKMIIILNLFFIVFFSLFQNFFWEIFFLLAEVF